MERKATDILLDLEDKLDKLLLHVANMDNNYKIIISRLDQLKNNNSVAFQPKNAEISSSFQPDNSGFSVSVSNSEIIDKKESKNSIQNADNQVKHEKIRVSQVVRYPKGKNSKQNNVVLASVKIYDSKGVESGSVVGENRTDQNGRWKIDLSPGSYFVHILKPASTQKPQVDHYFPIDIDGEKSVMELDPIG